jgi:hypothetical protein
MTATVASVSPKTTPIYGPVTAVEAAVATPDDEGNRALTAGCMIAQTTEHQEVTGRKMRLRTTPRRWVTTVGQMPWTRQGKEDLCLLA